MQEALVASGTLLATLGWYQYNKQYKQKSNEAPLVAGVPVLGMTAQFAKDPRKLVHECRQKYGEVFTLYLMGRRLTYVCDPHAHPKIYKEPQLNFEKIKAHIANEVFLFPAEQQLRTSHTQFEFYNTYLQGNSLVKLSKQYLKTLNHELGKLQNDQWVEGMLYQWSIKLMFDASSNSLWGEGFSDNKFYESFRQFDKDFPTFVSGLPQGLLKYMIAESVKARTYLIDTFDKLKDQYANQADISKVREQWMSEDDELKNLRGSAETTFMWASQANSSPAAFWVLYYILCHKDAKDAVYKEIDEKLKTITEDNLVENLSEFTVLESAITEALRLSAASASIREAEQDGTLALSDGKEFSYRKGDTIVIAGTVTHYDPDLYPEPEKYKYDRFIGNPKFFKNGKQVTKNHVIFGGGASLCPGRNFAKNEIKIFVIQLLKEFDIEVIGDTTIKFDETRFQFGMYLPIGDVKFRFKRKNL